MFALPAGSPGARNSRCGSGSKEQATAVFECLERSGSAAQLRSGGERG
jgi:hypothetical protein